MPAGRLRRERQCGVGGAGRVGSIGGVGCLRNVAGVRQPALAADELVGHHVASVGIVEVEPQPVPHFVHHHGEEIHVAGRRAAGVGLQPRRARWIAELEVVDRGVVDEPAAAGGVVVDGDPAVGVIAELGSTEIGDGDTDAIEHGELIGREPGRRPARDCRLDERG